MDNQIIETELEQNIESLTVTANSLTISTQSDYEGAVAFVKDIKQTAKQISDYWKPLKESAQKAHKAICEREKALLSPLEEAERSVKKAMVEYDRKLQEEAERQRRVIEEQRREAERLQREAEAALFKGNDLEAEMLQFEAESKEVIEPVIQQKTAGVSYRTIYKAEIINPSLVPIEIAGVVIRPIDIREVEKLAQVSKGAVQIPGIRIYEDKIASIR
jgi:chromosome segregation ATPase